MQFRNFLRPPSEAERFGAGIKGGNDRMRQLMSGVAKQLSMPYPWKGAGTSGRKSWENPRIPSGYTYLAQLVAHDCVFTSVPTGALCPFAGHTSRRSSLLRLETIYGLGPDSEPDAYLAHGANYGARSRLAIGGPYARHSEKGLYLFRDVGRATVAPDESAAQLADARNDIHAALAQLTTLFILLHNRIAADVEAVLAGESLPNVVIRGYRIYFISRMLCEHIYRDVIRHDLLPRILHPAVVTVYEQPSFELVDQPGGEALPIEFVSVLRFGHAMVRHSYVFNDLNSYGEDLIDMMLSTSAARPWRMPLDETWMAQWSYFFDMGGEHGPNLSRRIGPEFSGGLFSGEIFGPIDQTGSVGLGYRDLLSGAFVGLWSVSALADEIRVRKPELAGLSPLLRDDELRIRRLREWLASYAMSNGLSGSDIDDLARDPPLFLYVLFEAAYEMEGERLGVLASLVLAETLYGALRGMCSDRHAAIDAACMIALGHAHGAARFERCMPNICTMADLIHFVGQGMDQEKVAIPFV
ncbi:peroxidase family protein [Bradyrhizobium betae]|uniref:Animal haem peroxidase n=1 Tax=Bradyrhizobium betae TaxID=244734 RepID=A0A4V1P676_9BRAD|nr:peroxidase family protein [Bradyrhizobium betae]RXT46639.1 hypothetical protein B5V03_17080 [Bradyrhizobium betae]